MLVLGEKNALSRSITIGTIPAGNESAVLPLNYRPTRWKAKFGRMDVSEARKLKTLEKENAPLKMLLSLP